MGRRGLIAVAGFAVLVAAGCSTVPCADISDNLCPGRLYKDKVTPYGGVCVPQGLTFQATTPSAPFGAVIPPPVPVGPSPGAVPPPPSGPISIPPLPGPPPGGGTVAPVPTVPPPAFPKG